MKVELEDGTALEFPDGMTPDEMKAAIDRNFPKKQSPDVVVDMAKGAGYGFNEGLDATLNMLAAPIRAPINYLADLAGYGQDQTLTGLIKGERPQRKDLIPPIQLASRFNVAGPAETQPGRIAQAVGEVAGSSALPAAGVLQAGRVAGTAAGGILGHAARAPGQTAGLEAASVAGSGAGVSLARENEMGPVAEVGLGLLGGVAVPNAGNIGARIYGAGDAAVNYAGRQIERARDPVTAAFRDVADRGVESGMDFQAAQRAVAPPPSANLQARGFTENDLADIISRQANGENADDIVRDYAHLVDNRGRSITGDTARVYYQRYQDQNPVDLNVVDLAKIQRGTGGAMPLSNQARADMAIADDPIAAQRLIERQRAQPGRVAEVIEQSSIDGRNLDDELAHLSGVGRQEERAAYNLAHQNAQPVDLLPEIRAVRRQATGRKGEISEKLNQAADLFYQPVLSQRQQSPAAALRITELEERLADAVANNAPAKRIAWLERRLATARDQDEFGRPLKQNKIGEPITDLRQFLDARRELDQMISKSMQDGRASPLTRELTDFRTRINNAARRNNPALVEADARFSENRSIERIIGRGGDLAKRLTPQSRRALREFRQMTPTQQEIMRVAFEQRMRDEALNVRRGNAAADQFSTDAFDEIVAALYPAPRSARGPQRTAETQIHHRGQDLVQRLRTEAVTTETARDALSGSRTAALQDDMAALMEGPRAAADALTGRFGKLLENLSNRLTRQIGQRAAQERIRILTDTDPATRLSTLRRLADEARTAGERAEWEMAIRQFARVGRRPGAEIGTVTPGNESSDRQPQRR